jgi:predicted AlkP superfamily phosphohydrolase/phosphomutase
VNVPARVLFVGLDASDKDLLERWAGEDQLPNFRRIRAQASEYQLANTMLTLPTGVWPEIWSGRSCGRSGFYFPIRQLHTGETAVRPLEPGEVDATGFWSLAADAGRRVAAVDIPWDVTSRVSNCVHVSGWGTHDRPFGTSSSPPQLLDELRARHGEYPLWTDTFAHSRTHPPCYCPRRTDAEFQQLLDGLLDGLDAKLALFLDLLDREEWDLFACAFGEPQCVGHQFWHFLDSPQAPQNFRDAIRDVYRKLDHALGRVIEAAGDEAVVLVLASQAMDADTGGAQLIPEVLVRLGFGSGDGAAARLRSRLPLGLRAGIRSILPAPLRTPLQATAGSLPSPLESSRTRAVAFDGDTCSWIRLNVKGREPHGSVSPDDAASVLEELRTELLALEDPVTGEPIVLQAVTALEAFGPEPHIDVPDLMVAFRQDLGRIDACRSERVGLVRQIHVTPAGRSAAHPHAPSWLWISGAGFEPGARHEGDVLDIAPTVLSLLDVPTAPTLDGLPLERTAIA